MAGESPGDSSKNLAAGADSGGSKLVTAISILNLLGTLGMGGILFVSFQRDKERVSIADIESHGAEKHGESHESPQGSPEGSHGKEGHKEGETDKEAIKKSAIDFGKMVTLEQFTVNLATTGSVNPKFARVNISIEVPTEITENELNVKMPQVRNTIIDLFNSKRPSDLANVDGREYLKDEIKNAINSFMVSGKVKGVYFTSFAVSG